MVPGFPNARIFFRHPKAGAASTALGDERKFLGMLSPRQVAGVLGHSTSRIKEMYYVKKDTTRLQGITGGFNF